MTAAAQPRFKPGRVYGIRDLARWGANPTRLAERLVRELMSAFLRGGAFVFTGPDTWSALGLGSTALFAHQLVYNTEWSGLFQFGNRRFLLRRVRVPRQPTPEWYAVDLIENHESAGVALDEVEERLRGAVVAGRLRAEPLRIAANRFGSRETRAVVTRALERAIDP